MTTAKRPRTLTAAEEAYIRKNFGWRADAVAELDAERLISDELAGALRGIVVLDDGDETFVWKHPEVFDAARRALARWEGK